MLLNCFTVVGHAGTYAFSHSGVLPKQQVAHAEVVSSALSREVLFSTSYFLHADFVYCCFVSPVKATTSPLPRARSVYLTLLSMGRASPTHACTHL